MFILLDKNCFNSGNFVAESVIDTKDFYLQNVRDNNENIYYLCNNYESDNYVSLSKKGYEYIKGLMLGGNVED